MNSLRGAANTQGFYVHNLQETTQLMSIVPFVFESQQVRYVGTYGDEPWWIAADICTPLNLKTSRAVLGYEKKNDRGESYRVGGLEKDQVGRIYRDGDSYILQIGLDSHVEYTETWNADEIRGASDAPPEQQDFEQDSYLIVSQAGVFSLIHKSNKPAAKRFQKWVYKEVLPSIMRTGQYDIASPNNKAEFAEQRQAMHKMNEEVKRLREEMEEMRKKDGWERIPSILPPSTPAADIPSDYIETEEGYWISPRQYQSMKNNSKKNLGWEIRQVNPKTPYNPINDKVDADYTPYNLESTLSEEQKKKQRVEIEKLVKPISEEENQRLADMKRKARYLLDEF